MRSPLEIWLYASATIAYVRIVGAIVFEGRDPAAARVTAFPTVPAFSAPQFTYGQFSQVYPSGYTLPSGPFVTVTSAASTSAHPTRSHSHGANPHDAKASYLSAMCAPQGTKGPSLYDKDQRWPCNRVSDSTNTCVYNATIHDMDNQGPSGFKLKEMGAEAQQACLCPGGKGERIWEDIEGCDTCLRLHGGTPLKPSNKDDFYNFLPTGYVKDLSSAYCAQKTASIVWTKFAAEFSATHSISFGTETGGTDILKGKTAVSNYFTETSSGTPSVTIGTTDAQKHSALETSVTLKPATTSQSSSTGTATTAASSTGGATSLGASAILGRVAGLLTRAPKDHKVHAFVTAPYFLLGSKAFTVTTSSHKKRRLSPPEDIEVQNSTQTYSSNGTTIGGQLRLPSSSPPLIAVTDQSPTNSFTPRFIPPHLVAEGARQGRSPTPELSTGASSPSTAYAGLTLNTEEGGQLVENRNAAGRRGSGANKEKLSGPAFTHRSSSPATKRPAADMEGNMDGTADQHKTGKDGVFRRQSHTLPNRSKRNVSVDMVDESGLSVDDGSVSTEPTSGIATLQSGAYRTPATSTSESSSREQESSGLSPASSSGHTQIPTIDEQISKVEQLTNRRDEEGQKGYVISNKWLARVLSRSSNTDKAKIYPKEAAEGSIGPVDNTDLVLVLDPTVRDLKDEKGDPYTPMRPDISPDDYTIVPEEAWDLIIKWYGLSPGSATLARYCHNTSHSEEAENLQFELLPPIFTILKLPDLSDGFSRSTLADRNLRPVKTLASRHEVFQSFLARAKKLANIDLKVKVRVWKVLGGLGRSVADGIITPEPSRDSSPAPGSVPVVDPGQSLTLDVNAFANLDLGSQREIVDVKDETANEKYNGRATLGLVGLLRSEVLVLEEQVGGPAGGEWVSDVIQSKANSVPVSLSKNGATIVKGTLKPKTGGSSGRTSPAPSSTIMTRGRTLKNGKVRGKVGLGNLGNTCYMNSALQCLRSVRELVPYFINGVYKKEINSKNLLGYKGALAKAYAALLSEIYSESNKSSFSPRDFKNIVGRNNTIFSGYNQQDSQEFLGWLLSGLEEDLCRIQVKPYIEKPDSTDEMVYDSKALQGLADQSWDIYLARNDSIVSELFAGMYKSTLACPECSKVSIIFDPFSTFTLQLPVENPWYHTVYYYPLYAKPIYVAVDVDKNASMMAVKEFFGRKFNADPKKMMAVEVYKHKIFKAFDGLTSIAEERLTDNDHIAVFELEDTPTNWPARLKKAPRKALSFNKFDNDEEDSLDQDPALLERMLVAVHHRCPKPSGSRFAPKNTFGVPSFIMVSPDEAKDYDTILRKVLANVQCMTTKNILGGCKESQAEDSDTVLMSTDEVDDSSPQVQSQSVDSEDGMVDVSMRDVGDDSKKATLETSTVGHDKSKQRPPILDPGTPISEQLRKMFDMQVFSAQSDQTIPAGFSILSDESKPYLSMKDRLPKPKRSPKDQVSRRMAQSNTASSSEDEAFISTSSQKASSGSNSENELPTVQKLTQANHTDQSSSSIETHSARKIVATYSRKGKRSLIGSKELPIGSGPLIRLGEAIICDWEQKAYESLFGGIDDGADDLRGVDTTSNLPVQEDPELRERRRKRGERARNGISLEDCLDEFVKPETLSENDTWHCPQCKQWVRATKTFELWKCPDILIIHLKRFSGGQARMRDKLTIPVDFPIEGLDLSARVVRPEENKSGLYDLFAVDNHYGGLGGGHYTAFAKNFDDGHWYEYNDTMVNQVEPRKVVTPAAYILFYRRRSEKPLGGPLFDQLLGSNSDSLNESSSGSRATSLSGEGRRLDDSSRNGLSSALPEAEAVHQAGGGGFTEVAQKTPLDDDDPADPRREDGEHGTLEDLDDEGVDLTQDNVDTRMWYNHENNWSFNNIPEVNDRPPPHYSYHDIGNGIKSYEPWLLRRDSNSSTAVLASPASSRHDPEEDSYEEESAPIQVIDAPEEDDQGTGSGSLRVRGGVSVNDTRHDTESDSMLEDDERKPNADGDGDVKMD